MSGSVQGTTGVAEALGPRSLSRTLPRAPVSRNLPPTPRDSGRPPGESPRHPESHAEHVRLSWELGRVWGVRLCSTQSSEAHGEKPGGSDVFAAMSEVL